MSCKVCLEVPYAKQTGPEHQLVIKRTMGSSLPILITSMGHLAVLYLAVLQIYAITLSIVLYLASSPPFS